MYTGDDKNQEIVEAEINHYTSLLKIKKANTCENKELDNEIKTSRAKLETFGVDVSKFDFLLSE